MQVFDGAQLKINIQNLLADYVGVHQVKKPKD